MTPPKRTICLALLLLLSMTSGLADNVTVVQNANLTITCNNASQCVVVPSSGNPVFFTATDTNTSMSIPLTFVYEQNITVVQNITLNVTQSNQTVEITTQNITVVSCNESIDAATISTSVTNNLAAQLQTSLVTTCAQACKPSDDERNTLQNQKLEAERQQRECAFQLQAQLNNSQKDYTYLNATLSQQVDDLESQQILTYTLFFIGMLALVGGAVIVFRKAVLRNYVKGRAKRETPGVRE